MNSKIQYSSSEIITWSSLRKIFLKNKQSYDKAYPNLKFTKRMKIIFLSEFLESFTSKWLFWYASYWIDNTESLSTWKN